MLRKMRRAIRRIKKMISWFPIIYKDYDWDHHYYFRIMHKKLEMIHEEFSKYEHIEHNKNYMKALRICIFCAKRLMQRTNDEWDEVIYPFIYFDSHKARVGGGHLLQIRGREYPKYAVHERDYNDDIEMFFRYFNRYHKGWWD